MNAERVRWAATIAGAAVLGVGSWLWFASRPGMPVLVGTRQLAELVPAHYQACVFPAFGALIGLIGLDLVQRSGGSWRGRAMVVAVTSALSVLRLLGWLPMSGHALFLSAAMVHERATPDRDRVWLFAIPGLGVTAWYKLAVWDDPLWFVVSCAAGALVGWVAGRVVGTGRR